MNVLRKRALKGIYSLNRINSISQSSAYTAKHCYQYKHFCASAESIESKIKSKLEAEFEPTELNVYDSSGGCGSFFGIEIKSSHFNGLKTFQQHKLVNKVLKEEIATVHGLTLKTHPTDTK